MAIPTRFARHLQSGVSAKNTTPSIVVSKKTFHRYDAITNRLIFATLLFSFAVGCAAIGPTSSPEFPQLVEQAVPKGEGAIHSFGSGNWYPNTRGFTPIRSSLLARPPDPIPGVLVLTSTAILFQQWDNQRERFDIVKRIAISDLMEASLDTYGLNRRVVVPRKDFFV